MKNFKTAQDVISFAVKIEEEAIRFYTELGSLTKSETMKKAFEDFAQEEREHLNKILSIDIGNFTFSENTPITDLHIEEYINPEISCQSLSYGEILVIALNREKRAFRLYQKLSRMVNDSKLKKIFLSLAKDEGKHINRFETEYDEYAFSD